MEKVSLSNIFKSIVIVVSVLFLIFIGYYLFANSCKYYKLYPEKMPWCQFDPSCEGICDRRKNVCPMSCWHYENKVVNEIESSFLDLVN